MSFFDASKPRSGIALWNSLRLTSPSPSVSHSLNKSITRAPFFLIAIPSCSAIERPEPSSMSSPIATPDFFTFSFGGGGGAAAFFGAAAATFCAA